MFPFVLTMFNCQLNTINGEQEPLRRTHHGIFNALYMAFNGVLKHHSAEKEINV